MPATHYQPVHLLAVVIFSKKNSNHVPSSLNSHSTYSSSYFYIRYCISHLIICLSKVAPDRADNTSKLIPSEKLKGSLGDLNGSKTELAPMKSLSYLIKLA